MSESPTEWQRVTHSITWPHLAVLLTVLLTYGFELFNFNVSADEPLYWNLSRFEMMQVWNRQGRWGMGLSAWVLPSTNVPVVPLAIGIVATTLALWWLARRQMGLGEWEAAFATSLAISMPALVFHFSFTINSLGLGLGYAACALAAVLVQRPGWWPAVGAVAFGAFAIGVYEGFAFALVTVFIAVIWRWTTWATVVRTASVTVGASVVWYVISKVVPESSSGYVSSILGLDKISSDPLGRLVAAVSRVAGVVLERWLYFGYSNPLPAILLVVFGAAALWSALTRPKQERGLAVVALVGLAAVPIVASFLTNVLFPRAMVFLPTIAVVLCGIALPWLLDRIGPTVRWIGVGVGVLAVAGQATLANGAFFSGTIVVDDETAVTAQVAATYRSLPDDFEGPLPTIIASRSEDIGRPESWAARSSFEAGVMGDQKTALTYMQMRGINVVAPTSEQVEEGSKILESMPAYPEPGYMRVEDGLLLINLSTVAGR